MSQSGFMDFCGAEEERAERGGFLQKREREISPPPIKQTRPPDLALAPPPLFFYEMVLFFSTTNFTLKKTKQKTKKKQKSWWTCNTNLYFSTHARTRTRVNMSSAVSDSARVVRLFISSLFVRALRARERALSAEEELCNVVPDDPPGWILSLSMGLSPSSSSAIRSRPDMS